MFILAGLNGFFSLFARSGIFLFKRSKGWLQGQRTISTRSSINSRLIDGSAPNYDQLNHIFRGFLDSARWLPKPIATSRESLIYQHILNLFARPKTVSTNTLLRDLNFKLSDLTTPDKIALAEGETVLFENSNKIALASQIVLSLPRQVLFCCLPFHIFMLFENRSIDTVGGSTAFDLTQRITRDRFGGQISNVCKSQISLSVCVR